MTGMPFSILVNLPLPRPHHEAESRSAVFQVFRLPDHPTCRAFPSFQTVAFLRLWSPVTAAGPRRLSTVFPV